MPSDGKDVPVLGFSNRRMSRRMTFSKWPFRNSRFSNARALILTRQLARRYRNATPSTPTSPIFSSSNTRNNGLNTPYRSQTFLT